MRRWKRFDSAVIQCMTCGEILGYSVACNSRCVDFNYHINTNNEIFHNEYQYKADRNARNGKPTDRLLLEAQHILCKPCHDRMYQAVVPKSFDQVINQAWTGLLDYNS